MFTVISLRTLCVVCALASTLAACGKDQNKDKNTDQSRSSGDAVPQKQADPNDCKVAEGGAWAQDAAMYPTVAKDDRVAMNTSCAGQSEQVKPMASDNGGVIVE